MMLNGVNSSPRPTAAGQPPSVENAALFKPAATLPQSQVAVPALIQGALAQHLENPQQMASMANARHETLQEESKEAHEIDDPILDEEASAFSEMPHTVQERDQREQNQDDQSDDLNLGDGASSDWLDGLGDDGDYALNHLQPGDIERNLFRQYMTEREQKQYDVVRSLVGRLETQQSLVSEDPSLVTEHGFETANVDEAVAKYGAPLAERLIDNVFPRYQQSAKRIDQLQLTRSQMHAEMDEFGGVDYDSFQPSKADLESLNQYEYTSVMGLDLRAIDGQIGVERRVNESMGNVLRDAFRVRSVANASSQGVESMPEDVGLSLYDGDRSMAFNQINQEIESLLFRHKDDVWASWMDIQDHIAA